MADLRRALYLIADEMRGMATVGKRFSSNVYENERSHPIMELATEVAALADEGELEEIRAIFTNEPWLRFSPALGVEAAVFDPARRILLVRRKDSGSWAMPGGLAEIGQTPSEAVLQELWEEAGLRGRVAQFLGVFDGRIWGTSWKVHMLSLAFLVQCSDLRPVPGVEMTDAKFFAPERLPEDMHVGHDLRVPKVVKLARGNAAFFDPAESYNTEMPMYQRPSD